jgi:hypothetical protein
MDKKRYVVTITLSLTVEINEDLTTLTDFITDLDYEFKSQTEGAEILYTNWLDCDDRDDE